MKAQRLGIIATVLGVTAACVAAVQVWAGGDKVVFPEKFAQGVMYYSFDRPDVKQYRKLLSHLRQSTRSRMVSRFRAEL
jgi:hypothetical protein